MSSESHFKELVRGKLGAAAEDIFSLFHRVIVDYEDELNQQSDSFNAAYKPVVKLHRTELPQQVFIKEEVIVEDQAPLSQDKSQDQEEPEPPTLEECQQEESSLELRLKQEPEELQLCSIGVESNKSEDQSVDWNSEEPDIKVEIITSVVSEANSDLQQCSLSAGVSPTGAEKEGDQEFESETQTQRPLGKNPCVSTTGFENPGLGSSSPGTSLQHQVMREKYVCQDCGRRFSLKSNLNRHKRSHTGDKPYACQTCGKRFSGTGHLKLHKLIHTGERPYACNTCGMRFMRRQGLKVHTRVHTGEKPFVCHTCNRSFSSLQSLKIHTRIHTGEKPYVCSECGRGFACSSAIQYHMRTAH